MDYFHLTLKEHFLDDIERVFDPETKLELSQEAQTRIKRCRDYLDEKMKSQSTPIYGITTGFGSLCNISVSKDQLAQLQRNLVVSHACGIGEEVPVEIVRLMIFLKIRSLSYGYSGIRTETIDRLVEMFNNKVYPVVYNQGSLGASGDLAPLANMSLPLLGLGEVNYEGKRYPAEEINKKIGWKPLTLSSKEGLALLNGTQFMLAYSLFSLRKAKRLVSLADKIAALSLEAFDGRVEPFTHEVHAVRPHKGQIDTAAAIRNLLEGSEIVSHHKEHVQDPYSFRCVPQVHGAVKDALEFIEKSFTTELNSATDNPTIIPESDLIISAGNFDD